MKYILIILITILIISCTKDDEITNSENGTKLVSIEYIKKNKSWQEKYFYTSNNKLNEIKDFSSLGRKYKIEYSKEKLQQFTTFNINDSKKIFRDSIIYNSNGNIEKVYSYSINSEEFLPLSVIYEFEYDKSGRLFKRATYFKPSEKYIRHEKYYWKGENIERIEQFNEMGELKYEFFFTFDDKINYKQNIPIYISDPKSWSKNNVTIMNWKDYVGDLEINCRPCKLTYKYNLDSFPVRIESNSGLDLKLKYE